MLHSSLLPSTGPFLLFRLVRLAAFTVAFTGLLASCSDDDEPETIPANPAKITVPQAALHPEGIQYDETYRHFLVSSRTKGQIGRVKDDSTYAVLADDPRLISTIGLNLDASRNRVLAAVSDAGVNSTRTSPATQRKLAAVAIFNSTTGGLISYTDLGSKAPNYPQHFANDIAVDAQGNAYITDSFAPVIYKLDLQGNATVFLENPLLSGGTGFGLNGIVFHPDGYLLVAKTNDGTLFKVPINDPNSFTKVTTAQSLSLTGADGLLLTDAQTLLVVAGNQSTVYRLSTTAAWASATETGKFATGAVSPTTITRRTPGDAYVLYPYQATSPRFAIVKTVF
ncbi:SMP-30/gluconolactonase/LRE family protein [Hymenobacter cellulosivorans]|uniref:SMP-30/gluconolactonase/LRE family protein n=1 Tax=Hymenobacter cellulosivorans TaxID=2932249 RepID=A0ABY4FDK2_9BACT|nr:SMP-30/gluconolactonase/LRE family protein [Hymenobacter cellulosivorans]UOQ54758.1 SMP-30/gluconolactonase/LRE family protein [Hymenobacter cellulosivorans]